MTEDTVSAMIAGFPNFAGFTLLGVLLYRALMASIANNRELADQIIKCYRDDKAPDNSHD